MSPVPSRLSFEDIQPLGCSPLYYSLGSALMACVTGAYQRCELVRPIDLVTNIAVLGDRVRQTASGLIYFAYVFDRRIYGTGGMEYKYSTMPAEKISTILNQTLSNYTLQAGLGTMKICGQKDILHGRVEFYVAPFGLQKDIDWNALRNYIETLKWGCL